MSWCVWLALLVGWCVESSFLPEFVKSPSCMVVEELLRGSVDDGMCLCSIADSSSFGVLTRGVDGVDDGVGECGVAQHGLVIHEPYVHEGSVVTYWALLKGSSAASLTISSSVLRSWND